MSDNIHNAVFERLAKQGWITGSWVKDLPPDSEFAEHMKIRVEWTDLGKSKMRGLSTALAELGYFKKYEGENFSEELGFLATVAIVFMGTEGTEGRG